MKHRSSDPSELRRHADELRRVEDRLAAPIPDLETLDLTRSVRAAVRATGAPAAPPRRWGELRGQLALGALAALALGATILVARPRTEQPLADEMRAKSAGAIAAGAPERWAAISAYRVTGQGPPQRLGARLRADDGLLFAYTNLGARPFTHLMIFAVDASGEVRWFHPAYQQAGTNPQSIAIQASANVPLTDVIRHPFAQGPATVQALFSRRPLTVVEVEAWLSRRPAAEAPAPWPETYRQIVTTSIQARE